jgi:tRNA(fMet)-specific endonuclease VapC
VPYLIDTTWVIDHLAGIPEATELLDQLADEGIAISIIAYMEAFQGTERDPEPAAAQAKLERFLDAAPIVPFSPAVARRCARLREALAKQGKRVRPRALDLIIAATALEYDLTLVTRNLRDFDDIPRLRLSLGT